MYIYCCRSVFISFARHISIFISLPFLPSYTLLATANVTCAYIYHFGSELMHINVLYECMTCPAAHHHSIIVFLSFNWDYVCLKAACGIIHNLLYVSTSALDCRAWISCFWFGGTSICAIHGDIQIDWTTTLCASTAVCCCSSLR